MSARIFPIRLGIDCCYLIEERGLVLVDAGVWVIHPAHRKTFPADIMRDALAATKMGAL